MRLLILTASLFLSISMLAQSPSNRASQKPSFCESLTEINSAAETNFIALTATDYKEGTTDYKARVILPGFKEGNVTVGTNINMYYTGGTNYYNSLEEAKADFVKIKKSISDCLSNTGMDKKTDRQPEANLWTVTGLKDFMNNSYKVEITLAVWQNTKTKAWALEYFIIRKK